MSLPSEPGLQRRLAYGDIIRRRRSVTMNNDILQNYEQLASLPTVKVGASLKDVLQNTYLHICYESSPCVICQEETLILLDVVRSLGCKHKFHAKCIDKWLVENNKCPLCNKSVRI